MPTYLPISSLPAITGTLVTTVGINNSNAAQLASSTAMKTLLGIPGAGIQPLDATLTALAAYNTNGILTQTAADTFSGRTITGTANQITVTNGNGVSGNPTLSLDATLAALAALTITNGSFIRGTGADAFVVQPINGTVSQSGGVATGALFERGSNANGEYVRFADGTQICTFTDSTGLPAATADGALFRSASDGTWTYPIAFIAAPVVSANSLVVATNRWAVAGLPTTTTCTYNNYRAASSAGLTMIGLIAIGRWY